MALLEFQCNKCREIFDKLVFGDDRSNISCPQCGSKDYKQVFQGKLLVRLAAANQNLLFVLLKGDCPAAIN